MQSEFEEESVWKMLGKKWTYPIICILRVKPVRFGELKRLLEGISGTVLSERLVELAREGLVTRNVERDAMPPVVEYGLTDSAKELELILGNFASRWRPSRNGKTQVILQ
jgi:DNA-binding HxlR family transcriptional regulator